MEAELTTAEQFDILRREGTERAFTSPLNEEKRPGVFVCAGCSLPLFTSAMKFDSGTGWPSFFTSIPEVFATKRDFKLIWPRTEYHCVRCGGHHGHVFDDGPPPTGQRWCNNGVALRFIPKTDNAGETEREGKAELVNGEIVLMSPTGGIPGRAGGLIYASLLRARETTQSRYAFPDNVGFLLTCPVGVRSPEAAWHTDELRA